MSEIGRIWKSDVRLILIGDSHLSGVHAQIRYVTLTLDKTTLFKHYMFNVLHVQGLVKQDILCTRTFFI